MKIDFKQLSQNWQKILQKELAKPNILKIPELIAKEENNGLIVYPPAELVFNSLKFSDFEDIKVVIMGQDPYHGSGQANGLSFSVSEGIKPPPSLRNIFKELKADINFKIPKHGNLEKWAQQGVLMLNSSLTVSAGKAGSHKKLGWECFTDGIIKKLGNRSKPLVFILWGRQAQKKENLIQANHLLLKAAHPSPLSAYKGFFGCRHFSKTNLFLCQNNENEIDWQI